MYGKFTPNKSRKKSKQITGLDDIDKGTVRRLVYNFHITKKRLPTVELSSLAIKDRINFQGSGKSLHLALKEIRFKWKKLRIIVLLVEKNDIRNERISYLQGIKKVLRV